MYVVIQGGLFFELSSVVQPVDVCIKACFVLGLKFPKPAKSSWTFMKEAVFGITDVDDFSSNRLLELLHLLTTEFSNSSCQTVPNTKQAG